MKITGPKPNAEPPFPERIASKASLNPRTDLDLQDGLRPRKPARRRPRTPGFGRVKRVGAPTGRRSRPETPLLKWKVEKSEDVVDVAAAAAAAAAAEGEETGGRDRRKGRRGEAATAVSARKLAAGLWRLQVPETVAVANGGLKRSEKLGFQDEIGHEGVPFHHRRRNKAYGSEAKEYLQSPSSSSRNGYPCKAKFSNSAMEGVTKWDPVSLKTSDEARAIYRQTKLIDQQVSAASVVAALEAELDQAQSRIQDLETERRSSKKKLEHFLRKVGEEKAAWRSREHEKIRLFVDDLKSELTRERKARQRAEMVNSKLVNELADSKLSVKRLALDYEKERKARELIEEVCDELAKEIGEDKAEVEALKRESMKMRDEVDEERRMLQMAEVWREERVQMKLVDAKVALEEKYSHMNKLVSGLENFLASGSKEVEEAEILRDAVASVKIRDAKEFTYVPPNPDDIFSVFEEVNFGAGGTHETEISPPSHASRIHTVSPEIKGRSNEEDDEEDESGWETVSHVEDRGSSYGSAPSVNKNRRDSNVSGSGTEWDDDQIADHDRITEIGEVCSVPAKQFNKKGSSITRLWRSRSNSNNNDGGGENFKIISVEGLVNGRDSNAGTMSPEKDGLSLSDLPEQWSSPESGTGPARGMNRCIPRAGQKQSLKAKLLEARIESQKVQLRHVLKQKY